MADSKSYLAPLGLALVGALFGIGHFGGLNKVLFGSDESYFVEQIAIPMATYSKETFLLKGLSLAKQNRFTCLTKVVLTM